MAAPISVTDRYEARSRALEERSHAEVGNGVSRERSRSPQERTEQAVRDSNIHRESEQKRRSNSPVERSRVVKKRVDPSSNIAYLKRVAAICLGMGKGQEALEKIEACLKMAPEDTFSKTQKALALFQLKQVDAAMRVLENITDLKKQVDAQGVVCQALCKAGEYRFALLVVDKFLEKNRWVIQRQNPVLFERVKMAEIVKANLLLELEDYPAAILEFDLILKKNPNPDDFKIKCQFALVTMNLMLSHSTTPLKEPLSLYLDRFSTKARAYVDEIIQKKPQSFNGEAFFIRAFLNIHKNQIEQGFEDLKKGLAISGNEHHHSLKLKICKLLEFKIQILIDNEKEEEALKGIQMYASTIAPQYNEINHFLKGTILLLQAYICFKGKHLSEGLKSLSEGLPLCGNFFSEFKGDILGVLSDIIESFIKEEKYKEAFTLLWQGALKISSDANIFGCTLEVIKKYKKQSSELQNDMNLVFAEGNCHLALGNFGEALKHFERFPNEYLFQVYCAKCALGLGDFQMAIRNASICAANPCSGDKNEVLAIFGNALHALLSNQPKLVNNAFYEKILANLLLRNDLSPHLRKEALKLQKRLTHPLAQG